MYKHSRVMAGHFNISHDLFGHISDTPDVVLVDKDQREVFILCLTSLQG